MVSLKYSTDANGNDILTPIDQTPPLLEQEKALLERQNKFFEQMLDSTPNDGPPIKVDGLKPMFSSDGAIEQEIQAKGKTAPRVTPADIEANIACEHYFTAADGVIGAKKCVFKFHGKQSRAALTFELLTFCVLTLRNGFTVTGESACASPENFDAEIGRKVARAKAIEKIWPLMGYQLREQLHQA